MAGCSIQARPFTPQEASDGAVAVCNLGLENWPLHWLPAKARRVAEAGMALPDDFLVGHDLVSVFQVGWTVLHDDVCQYAAERLVEVLARGVTTTRFKPDSTAGHWDPSRAAIF
jgi:hypothetical protein